MTSEKMEKKEMDEPSTPFLYVSGRPYLPLTPAKPKYPESLVEKKGDCITKEMGRIFEMRFDISPRISFGGDTIKYSPYASSRAKLTDFAKIPYDGSGFGQIYEVFDWYYRFAFEVTDEDIKRMLLERRDHPMYGIDSRKAFGSATAHWGTARWSALTLDLLLEGESKFRTDVDVFAPSGEDPSGLVIIGAYSHKPDILKKMYADRFLDVEHGM